MRNGPPKGIEWDWLDDEIARLEETAKRMKSRSQTWRARYAELMEWIEGEGTAILTVKEKSHARARLRRLTWETK